MRNEVLTWQLNPFVKYKNMELFGLFEHMAGRRWTEMPVQNRTWNQYAIDAVYRFGDDKFYGAFRYNYVEGKRRGDPCINDKNRISVNRVAIAGGWFPLPYMLTKVEFVSQNYSDFPSDDILYEGHFHGVTDAAVLGF